jgi:hypothetical protein
MQSTNTQKTIRLNGKGVLTPNEKDNYVKPSTDIKTFQQSLQEDDITVLLEDYIEVEYDDLVKIPMNTHLRYFIIKQTQNGEQKLFRMGGNLVNKDNPQEYLVVSNGKHSWSIQVKNAIIYRKLTNDEIKEEYKNIISQKDNEIKKYRKEIKRLRLLLSENNIDYK